jgi:hypothetical protein
MNVIRRKNHGRPQHPDREKIGYDNSKFSTNVLGRQGRFGKSDVELSGQDVCGDLPPTGTFGGHGIGGVRLPPLQSATRTPSQSEETFVNNSQLSLLCSGDKMRLGKTDSRISVVVESGSNMYSGGIR